MYQLRRNNMTIQWMLKEATTRSVPGANNQRRHKRRDRTTQSIEI